MNNKIKKLICSISTITLLAIGCSFANAQSEKIQEKLSQTQQDVTKLLNIKDDTSISEEKKISLEIELKKKIISDVINISLDQIANAQSQLDDLKIPDSQEWKSVRDYFQKIIDQTRDYYEDRRKEFDNKETWTLDDVKVFAKAMEEKRSLEIDKNLKRINSLILTVNVSQILNLADERLSKISSDVDRIYTKKLTKNPTLKTMLEGAAANVKKSHDLNDEAYQVVLNLYTEDKSTSTQDFILNLKKKIVDIKEFEALIDSKTKTEPIKIDSSLITNEDLDGYLISLTSQTYNQIKSAYETFVKMSVNVKSYLK